MDNQALILDLIEWIAEKPRTYAEVMRAWRTSCPRLPVWEDAVDHGLVRRESRPEGGAVVVVTEAGRGLLAALRVDAVVSD
jgi:hypothetical protein